MVLLRPYKKTDRVVIDTPFLIIEVLSPDDRMRNAMQRFREYERLGVKHIIQMDPEERITHVFEKGGLFERELTQFELPDRGPLPFDSRALLAQLDEE